jgi:hypothetical protein
VRRVLPAAAALLLLAGCKVDTTVAVELGAGGTGRVRAAVVLDRAAAARVPDLAEQLRADDLRAAGWQVEGPERTDAGGVRIQAVKRFRTPAEASRVVEELTGPSGPFRDFRLRRVRSFVRTDTAFSGVVDLGSGIEGFGDDDLRKLLGGSALGLDPAELEEQLGTPLPEVFTFEVTARLPGGDPVVWHPRLGERIELSAAAEQWNVRGVVSAAVSAAAAVALLVILLRRRRHPHSRLPVL